MAKAASGGQTSTAVTRGGRGATGTVAGTGLRQRRPARSTGTSGRGVGQSIVNFYTDDTPGLKIQPVWVIVMSLGFILSVTVLHIIGKLRA
ncbi:Protein transport protein Sec61 subunit beta [Monoraphidium neglectum]|uniref:Protein transport protein Sec61 subunit beta n=1 Tax=Monoraphidium neglectum TaxID=145388 RepID=A0A0D2K1Y3_9CHLO|nr:Protein transport protein Sec61 subunit beta [Monoraphidium neglectum]KIZ04573.1 Protein transport protein Sec61 subunit beta [Monoraphidium neglectum]|eukprot:XP_013903592.1 Protein transport protein Sec61 subunit beta [Monoraphidium neglectum]